MARSLAKVMARSLARAREIGHVAWGWLVWFGLVGLAGFVQVGWAGWIGRVGRVVRVGRVGQVGCGGRVGRVGCVGWVASDESPATKKHHEKLKLPTLPQLIQRGKSCSFNFEVVYFQSFCPKEIKNVIPT